MVARILQAIQSFVAKHAPLKMLKKQDVVIEGRDLVLSNSDKICFPDDRFTKGQIIACYSEIAETIIPPA